MITKKTKMYRVFLSKRIPLDANILNGIEIKINNLLYDEINKSSKIDIKMIKKSLLTLSNLKNDMTLRVPNKIIKIYMIYADSVNLKSDCM